jgi:hypothetical protein
MSTTLAETLPITPLAQTLPLTPLATIWPDFAVVCLFSLLGLTLSAVAVSCVSSETITIMFSQP